MKRFRGLTPARERVFEQIALNNDQFHSRRVLSALENSGLIVGHTVPLLDGGWPPVTVTHWTVPLRIHMEWCAFCSENFADEATP